jgi:streptogramin lyase
LLILKPLFFKFKYKTMKKINNFLRPSFRVGLKTLIPFLLFFIFSIAAKAQVWTTYNTTNTELASNGVSSIAIDAQGNKWFGTDNGVSKLDNSMHWTTYNTTNTDLAFNIVLSIAIDDQGNKWFGTFGGGVSKFDDNQWKTYKKATNNGLASNDVYSIVIDAQGNKWFGTSNGVSKFDDTNWKTYNTNLNNVLGPNYVLSIAIDAQGNKWFGSTDGVSKFDGSNWTIYNTTNTNNGLAKNYIKSIAIDAQGNKWVGTYDGGVSKFDGNRWTIYNTTNTNNGLASNDVKSIAIDAQGNKWIGTSKGGVSKFGMAEGNIEKGLIAYYPLDGDAKDKSTNKFDGAPSRDIAYTEGVKGKAALFDGKSQILLADKTNIEAFKKLSPSGALTISLWVKYAQNEIPTGDTAVLIRNRSSGYMMSLDNNNLGCTAFIEGERKFNTYHKFDLWRHMVMTFNGNTLTYYVDGVLVDKIALAGLPINITYNLDDAVMLGRDGTAKWYFKGLIDEVRIYDRAITEDEVKLLYEPPASPISKGLIAHYPLNIDEKDIGPNKFNGNPVNIFNGNPVSISYKDGINGRKAAQFDENSSIILTDATNPSRFPLFTTQKFTVSAWYKSTDKSGTGTILSIGSSGYSLNIRRNNLNSYQWLEEPNWVIPNPNRQIKFSKPTSNNINFNDNPSQASNLPSGLMTLTFDGKNMTLYHNGKFVAASPTSFVVFSNVGTVTIGGGSFKGLINDVRFYDRALNDSEVRMLYSTVLEDSKKVSSIFPNKCGSSDKPITFVTTVIGKGFVSTATASLIPYDNPNDPPIKARAKFISSEELSITWEFPAYVKPGKYRLAVDAFADGKTRFLPDPAFFQIEKSKPPSIKVEIIGPSDRIAWKVPTLYTVTIQNKGNVPLYHPTITIVIKNFTKLSPLKLSIPEILSSYPVTTVTPSQYEELKPFKQQFISDRDVEGYYSYSLILSKLYLRPNEVKKVSFELTSINPDLGNSDHFGIGVESTAKSDFELKYEIIKNINGLKEEINKCNDCDKCAFDITGYIPFVNCATGLGSVYCAVADFRGDLETDTWANLGFNVVGYATGCGTAGIAKIFKGFGNFAFDFIKALSGGQQGVTVLGDCASCLTPERDYLTAKSYYQGLKGDKGNTSLTTRGLLESPHIIYGSKGYTDMRYKQSGDAMSYFINFNNKDTSTVSTVIIKDQLDTSVFDLSSFRFNSYGWGNTNLSTKSIEADTLFFDTDLRPKKNIIVRHYAFFNRQTGAIEWQFESLDADTYEVISDKSKGFLPPNDSTANGQGFVSYSVDIKENLPHNTKIINKADIALNSKTKESTNIWINTIDAIKPKSKIKALPSISTDTIVKLIIEGSDVGSGAELYDIYVSENNSSFKPLYKGIRRDTVIFIGKNSKTYGFFSQARDYVGNWEDTTHIADATIKIDRTNPVKELKTGEIKIYPNPSTGTFNVESPWGATPVELYVTDWAGRVLYQQKFTHKDVIEVQLKNMPFGIYYVSLKNELTRETKVAKLVHE